MPASSNSRRRGLFNLLLGVVRGTGNLILPLVVVCGGAAVAAAAMPILIFGWGPVPAFGLIGGALAMIGYYAAGSVCLLLFLFGHRGVLRPRAVPPVPQEGRGSAYPLRNRELPL